jgi:hypothetical protein
MASEDKPGYKWACPFGVALVLLITCQVLSPSSSIAQQRGDTGDPAPSKDAPQVGKKSSKAAIKAEAAERKKAVERWRKTLEALHTKGFHQRGRDSADRRAKAEAELDAIDDPVAVPAIWLVFAGRADHHSLIVRMLGRFDTTESTSMLAAVSVYSPDEKARLEAAAVLKNRNPRDFAENLIQLIQVPLKFKPGGVDIPGLGRARVLMIEDERVDYQFFYPPPEQAEAPRGKPYVFTPDNPYMTKAARKQAQEFNRAQAQAAKAAIEAQLQSDIEEIGRVNLLIGEMRERALVVLRQVSGKKKLGPDREAWRRWLADRGGYRYEPPAQEPKQTLALVVPHLYRPSFLTIPAAT